MLIFIIICLIAGAVGGLLQGMLGVGTGVVVIPLLTMLLPHFGVSPAIAIRVALATSMAAIVFSSISSVLGHHQHRNLNWSVFKKIVFFSIIGSLLGAVIASYMPARSLEIIFSLFLFFVAYKMLRKKKQVAPVDAQMKLTQLALGVGGLVIGIVASMVGIGGGLLMVPFLHSRHLEMRYAVGTSTLVGLPVAITGAITYIVMGLKQIPPTPYLWGYVYWPALLSVSATGIFSAFWGAKLAKSLPTLLLQRIFAVCVVVVAIKMLV